MELSGIPSPAKIDGPSLVPILKKSCVFVKSAALTQHPRPTLYFLVGWWSAGIAASDGLCAQNRPMELP